MTPSKMKVSVITTVYNDSHYLDDCLKSIRDQTVSKDLVEHIVWDDGSTDTRDLEQKVEQYPHAKFFINNENKGLPAARNSAIKKADGEAFLFLDADDYFSLNTVEDMIKVCKGHRSPVYPTVQFFGATTTTLKKPQWTKEMAMSQLFIPAASLVTRKSFEAVGGFTEGLPLFEDFDLWYRLAKNDFKGYYCPSAVLYYNIRKDSMSDHFNLKGLSSLKEDIYKQIVSQ